jgi:hypothetical protein
MRLWKLGAPTSPSSARSASASSVWRIAMTK